MTYCVANLDNGQECHYSCEYGTSGYYPYDYSPDAQKCSPCEDNCLKCSNYTNCQECTYSKKRYQGSINSGNFLENYAAETVTCNETSSGNLK